MIRKYAEIFCWKNVSSFCSVKATHIFSAKNIKILCIESAKTVNEMTLNELVKLTTLWTTGPWSCTRILLADRELYCAHKSPRCLVWRRSSFRMFLIFSRRTWFCHRNRKKKKKKNQLPVLDLLRHFNWRDWIYVTEEETLSNDFVPFWKGSTVNGKEGSNFLPYCKRK